MVKRKDRKFHQQLWLAPAEELSNHQVTRLTLQGAAGAAAAALSRGERVGKVSGEAGQQLWLALDSSCTGAKQVIFQTGAWAYDHTHAHTHTRTLLVTTSFQVWRCLGCELAILLRPVPLRSAFQCRMPWVDAGRSKFQNYGL